MASLVYYAYAGNEVINASRTEAYAKALKLGFFRPVYKVPNMNALLGDAAYVNPTTDNAPWYDVDIPASAQFAGAYPLSVEGIEDSTYQSAVTESTIDGGVISRPRASTKSVVFSVALVASTEAGAEYGQRWLASALGAGVCGPRDVFGADLCYLFAQPTGIGDLTVGSAAATAAFSTNLRQLRRVTVVSGPTITAKKVMSCGGAVWTAQFTAVAANPFEYSDEIPIVKGVMDPSVVNPYVPGVTGVYSGTGVTFNEVPCPQQGFVPISDPLCPAVTPPPGPPTIALGCYVAPLVWTRRTFTIPKEMVPVWGQVVPLIQVHARYDTVRNLRIRFHPDIYNTGVVDPNNPCSFCGDFVFGYVPQNSTLIFDGSDRSVTVRDGGGAEQRAESLVYNTDGTPFTWPEFACGFGYVVTLDLDSTETQPPVIDMSLFNKSA